MKRMTVGSLAVGFCMATAVAFAADVETDLPQEKKGAEKSPYYHDSTPLNAFHSIYSDIFIHKWLDAPHDGTKPIPMSEQIKISDNFIAHCRANKEYVDLLKALIYREKWDEAIAVAPEAVAFYRAKAPSVQKLKGFDLANYGLSYLHWADALLGAGRIEEAKAKLEETAKIGWSGYYNGGRATYPNPGGRAQWRLPWFDDDRLDKLKLPRWTDQKPFPEPHEAAYTETFRPCKKLSVFVKGFKADDPRIERLLALKMKSRGFEMKLNEKGGYPVEIALEPAAIDKPEGYTLEATEKGCVIKGHDMQGVLWGIVSFIQILDPEKHTIRLQKVRDWPAAPKRGYLGRCSIHEAEFMLFNKMNIDTAKMPCFLDNAEYTPLNLFAARQIAKDHNDFGLELYFGFASMTMDCTWPLCWKVFGAMQIENLKIWASCGVGVYYPYDDARYWESTTYTKEDRETGLKPSDYDADHLAWIYSEVKKEYPNFKMQFCPPFYWGPTKGHPYPDDREKYLKSLQKIPEEVSIFWTGERVGSLTKSAWCVEWFTKLIGRKPSLFQNKAGRHFYLSYGPDEMPWDEWYYDGFVDRDMRSIQKNSDTPSDYTVLSTLADFCWNPKAYDRARAVRRGLNQLGGKGLYEALKPAHDVIGKIDRYKYGRINTAVLTEDPKVWTRDNALIQQCCSNALAIAGEFVYNRCMGSWKDAVENHRNLTANICNPPDFRKRYGDSLTNILELRAQNDPDFDEAKDLYFDPILFGGGVKTQQSPKRPKPGQKCYLLVRIESGPKPSSDEHVERGETATLRFNLTKLPKEDVDFRMLIAAEGPANRFTFKCNETYLIDGEYAHRHEKTFRHNPFRKGKLQPAKTKIPKEAFKLGENILSFTNDSNQGYPIYLAYAILRGLK